MNKITLILFLIIFLLASCGDDKELPKGVLPEDKMVDLMVELEIVQATLKYDAASEGLNPNYTKEYNKVFESYNINKKGFNISLDYYCSEPLKVKNIYDKVIVKLSENQGKLNKEFINKGTKD
ncbi:MAG: DUF4296 domain-containing protein [Vicingaceae bacterium]|nr:DUF4296 domain-containing protein [Vicingaceae bacterium]